MIIKSEETNKDNDIRDGSFGECRPSLFVK